MNRPVAVARRGGGHKASSSKRAADPAAKKAELTKEFALKEFRQRIKENIKALAASLGGIVEIAKVNFWQYPQNGVLL